MKRRKQKKRKKKDKKEEGGGGRGRERIRRKLEVYSGVLFVGEKRNGEEIKKKSSSSKR